jgi:hypothetical protein
MRAHTVLTLVFLVPGVMVLGTLATFLITGLLITAAGPIPPAHPPGATSRAVHRPHRAHVQSRRPTR